MFSYGLLFYAEPCYISGKNPLILYKTVFLTKIVYPLKKLRNSIIVNGFLLNCNTDLTIKILFLVFIKKKAE